MKTLLFVGIFFLVCFVILMIMFAVHSFRDKNRKKAKYPNKWDVVRENARTLHGDNTK